MAADKRLLDALNGSIARELAVITQYMYQHVLAVGPESPEISEIFKKVSIAEMKHAEKFAERLDYLGGMPTTKPNPIKVADSITEMLKDDIAAEKEAITFYKSVIKLCIEINDPVTRLLYEEILTQEEDHDYTFTTILGDKKK